ncbi:MAU2 chromatid cohesion factor homolog isoform X1 [Sceloporus undulatus]|uniref:MAU2 chromatid cohesion factor homolog isoform X1 n=1 Tax=Sceloporus undulatus TaxID=8520 RepID=UPI001C4B3938|nr:MAU2 chromatid cohesion factor homolog isoform X1 [Sceloporus undulatus]
MPPLARVRMRGAVTIRVLSTFPLIFFFLLSCAKSKMAAVGASTATTAATTTAAVSSASTTTPASSAAASSSAAAASSSAAAPQPPPPPPPSQSAGGSTGAAAVVQQTEASTGGNNGSGGSSSSASSGGGGGGGAGGASESWYVALLGLAEHFRTSSPPKVRLCVHCLQAVLPRKPPARVEARTHLQLGSVLYHHTRNGEQARGHLEKAWLISQHIPQFEDVKFEAASLLSELYCQENSVDTAKPLLRKAIQISQQTPYWHCRLLFQLAQLHTLEKDLVSACDLLGVGAEYARVVGSEYTRALFLLSKGMLLLMERKLQEVHPLLTLCGQIVENWQGNPIQKESLRVFFLVLQVTHYLDAGQVKSVKPCLKQLQQCIQTISTLHDDEILPSNPADLFHWLPKEHMCVLVYLVTVMHSMQAGYLEKAQKYTDKALMQLEKLKMLDCSPILSSFQVILLEHIIMCRLVTGHKATALQEISQVCQLCQQSPRLFSNHAAQLHTLLGLYCISVNCMDNAEAQFTTALRLTTHQELWAFIVTNLASVYIREGNRHQELYSLLERINPDHNFPVSSHCLRAAAFYIRGLFSFFQGRYNEAKRFLRETLKMSNAEDLNRLTACSLVLLGHIFYVLGNHRESNNMVVPAMQLASKIPDMSVQLWSSALLRDLNKACGNAIDAHEAAQMHQNFSQQLLQDHIEACSLPEHNLITWTDGPPPVQFQAQNGPTTSLASLL